MGSNPTAAKLLLFCAVGSSTDLVACLFQFKSEINSSHFRITLNLFLKASLSARSYENEFNLHVKEISFSYERMSSKTRFEEETKGNLEMAYCLHSISGSVAEWSKALV